MTEPEQKLLERVARLEGTLEELRHDIRTLEDKLNGYLDRRIQQAIQAFIGKTILASLISSGALAGFLVWLFQGR